MRKLLHILGLERTSVEEGRAGQGREGKGRKRASKGEQGRVSVSISRKDISMDW